MCTVSGVEDDGSEYDAAHGDGGTTSNVGPAIHAEPSEKLMVRKSRKVGKSACACVDRASKSSWSWPGPENGK